jgi:hypothetical protein
VSNVWNPEKTWVFIVGLLEWENEDIYSSFPAENRRDEQLVELLIERGVPEDQVWYLQDADATSEAIAAALEEHLQSATPDATLIVYYSGHGSLYDDGSVYFASYDADDDENLGWAVSDIPDAIDERFPGNRAILLADCCHSGRLIDAVAAKRRRVAYATFGSSLASELSTGNWTFTEAILSALRGEAFTDVDGSNTITLAELAKHIQNEMAFAEEQVAPFATTPNFDPNLVLASAQPRFDKRLGSNVAVFEDGQWYLGQVTGVRKGELRVRYYGFEEFEDEWVSVETARALGRPRFPIGSTVEVKSGNKWHVATVKDERAGVHYIAYDDFDEMWNEWVPSRRIRPLV